MILKIEMLEYLPGPNVCADGSPVGGPPGSSRKIFHLIDHVEGVQYGNHLKITELPKGTLQKDGTVIEPQVFTHKGLPLRKMEEDDSNAMLLNVITFSRYGLHQIVCAAGNVYVCSDDGDTLEVVRAIN
jgi:hypothetical protein